MSDSKIEGSGISSRDLNLLTTSFIAELFALYAQRLASIPIFYL